MTRGSRVMDTTISSRPLLFLVDTFVTADRLKVCTNSFDLAAPCLPYNVRLSGAFVLWRASQQLPMPPTAPT